MPIWYVKKLDNVSVFKKIFCPIDIKNVDNKVIAKIPGERYAKKLEKKIYDKPNQNLVIMDNLNKEQFEGRFNILNGRWLFKYMIPNILKYVEKASNIELREQEVSIMVNNNDQNNLKILVQIAQMVKALNIVTDNIDGFRQLENYLLNEKGIAIHITNNKRKALLKSSIIFNIDFPENKFNQFYIPQKSIIVCIQNKIVIKSKRFNGINCNFYETELPQEFEKWFRENGLFGLTCNSIFLESMIYYKNSYESIQSILKIINIKYLIGNNGIIENDEFLKNFT